jgi:peptide/nickel transport system substrate-binding protein
MKEYVMATGQVANYDPGEGKTVRIDVIDSEGNAFMGAETEHQDPCCLFPLTDRKATPNDDGFYSYTFVIAGNETASKVGQTTIRASLDGKSVETAFEVTLTHVSSTTGQGILSVHTDKVSYTLNEYVDIRGQIANYNPGEGKTVRIDVFDPEDKVFTAGDAEQFDPCCLRVISGEEVEPNDDGSYSLRFYIATNLTSPFGQYTAQASYDGKSVETAFEVTLTHVSSTTGQGILSVQTDKSLYLLPDIVRDILSNVRDIPSGYVNVSGQIANYNPGEGKTVRIDVFDPEDKVFKGAEGDNFDPCCLRVISGEEVEPNDDGSFSLRFFIPIRSLMPDRINEFKQGLYTAQASYDGKSVETSFRIAETPGAPDLGNAIQKSLILTSNFSPARMVPGRESNQVLEMKNYGTADAQFLALVRFAPFIEYDQSRIFSFGDSEVVYSEGDTIVVSLALKPQESKIIAIPIKVSPEVVQFDQAELQEGKMLNIDVNIVTGIYNDIATLSPYEWAELANRHEGKELIVEAMKTSSENERSFFAETRSKMDSCMSTTASEEKCTDSILGKTEETAPDLADYIELLITANPDKSDDTSGTTLIQSEELTLPTVNNTAEGFESLFPPAYAQTSQAPNPELCPDCVPHVCPDCLPSQFTLSDHMEQELKNHEGNASSLSSPCSTDKDGKSCYYGDNKQDPYGFYDDSSGYCTTGIGHLIQVKGNKFRSCKDIDALDKDHPMRKMKDSLAWIKTQADAEKDYDNLILEYENPVREKIKVPLCQAQYDALVDFTFNRGAGNLNKLIKNSKINDGNYHKLEKMLRHFDDDNPKATKGIKNRRGVEADMFQSCPYSGCVRFASSMDPNHLYADPERYMKGDGSVFFTAMFENLVNATAPAFDVRVVTPIDQNFDIDTLNSLAVSHPNRLQNFTLDRSNREATWYFKDIELPPNKSPPEGEGWVKYSVRPITGLPTDSAMTSQARIFFDFNPPIDTNVVEHKIDRDLPSTKVKALPSEIASNSFDIEWEGSDQGSGINHLTIRVSREGDFESYEVLDTSGAVGNKMQFSGEKDQKYSFVSLAVDNVGNVETKSVADTSTTIKQSQSQCLIATAAFGSELSPQVGFLRNFRDNHILSTAAGSSFMNVFNTWYYSFSPYIADYERDQPWLQQTIKTAIYPLLGILTLAEKAYSTMPGEYGSVAAGLVASSLIGAVYFTPFAFSVKQIRTGKSKGTGHRLVLIALAAATASAAIMIVVFPLANPINLMISTSVLVIAALALASVLTASLAAKVAKELSIFFSGMFARNRKGTT